MVVRVHPRERLAHARLYLVCDARPRAFLEAALHGGVDIVQLRDKGPDGPLEARDELAALEVLADLVADVQRQPRGRKALGLLFHSAEAYLETWERAERRS